MRVLAVDLGASSLRIVAVEFGDGPPILDVVHRHPHRPVRHADGSLRWDWSRLMAEVEIGLEKGLGRGPVDSIGVDTWGVDYGLIDGAGDLLAAPFSYRSDRTKGWEETAARIGVNRLYRTSGIQLMGINTVFQLAVHDRGEMEAAEHLLMLPELVVHALSGVLVAERTSAGTTGLVDVSTGDWSSELIDAVGVEQSLFQPIQTPGTAVGQWRDIPVHLVGGHDTASAIAAAPLDRSVPSAFISSGTWMLVGAELSRPLLTDEAQSRNFSNEPSVGGGVRLLKNVMGLWMFEQCCTQWGVGRKSMIGAAAAIPHGGPVVDATDQRFLAPSDMAAEVRAAAGLAASTAHDVVARCVLDSQAAAAAVLISELELLTGDSIEEIVVVGGGANNALLNRLIAAAAEKPVRVGPVESSALGNALVQAAALGDNQTPNEDE